MKIFLDANILVSVLNKEYPLFTYASRIVSLAGHNKYEVCTSPVCLAIAFYFAEKKHKAALAKQKIKLLSEHIITTPIVASTVEKALQNNKVMDIEDGIEYYSAIESKCKCIVTEDIEDFYFADIEVLNCEAFFKKYMAGKK